MIRKALPKDLKALLRLHEAMDAEELALGYGRHPNNLQGLIEQRLRDKGTLFLVATRYRALIGFGYATADGRRKLIYNLFILPDYRRMGIASHILSRLLSWEPETTAVYAYVFKGSPFLRFWLKHGFKIARELENAVELKVISSVAARRAA